jgi:hypothetical protein
MLVAITASAAFRVARAGVAYVDLRKGAIVARAIMFATLYPTADTRIDIHTVFVHKKFLLFSAKMRLYKKEYV